MLHNKIVISVLHELLFFFFFAAFFMLLLFILFSFKGGALRFSKTGYFELVKSN